jgi:hypothetical protein
MFTVSNTVYTGGDKASYLLFPVIPADTRPDRSAADGQKIQHE